MKTYFTPASSSYTRTPRRSSICPTKPRLHHHATAKSQHHFPHHDHHHHHHRAARCNSLYARRPLSPAARDAGDFTLGSICHSRLTTSGKSEREKQACPSRRFVVFAALPSPPPPPPLVPAPAPLLSSGEGAVLRSTKWLGSRLRTTKRSSSSSSLSVIVRAKTRYGQALLSRSFRGCTYREKGG